MPSLTLLGPGHVDDELARGVSRGDVFLCLRDAFGRKGVDLVDRDLRVSHRVILEVSDMPDMAL